MTTKLAAYCWLLLALGGSAALAQTHPQKKPVRKHVVARRRVTKSVGSQSHSREPLLPPTIDFIEIEDGKRPLSSDVELPDSNRVYTYVEQMPTLNGQPVVAASIAAINQRLMIPPTAPDGRVFVGFEVTKTGSIRNVRLLKGLRADLDSAVVTATRQLPRFAPGKQSGHVVAVGIVVPVAIPARKQP